MEADCYHCLTNMLDKAQVAVHYCCFTAALLPLYYLFTAALLLPHEYARQSAGCSALLLHYCLFTDALLCFTDALLLLY